MYHGQSLSNIQHRSLTPEDKPLSSNRLPKERLSKSQREEPPRNDSRPKRARVVRYPSLASELLKRKLTDKNEDLLNFLVFQMQEIQEEHSHQEMTMSNMPITSKRGVTSYLGSERRRSFMTFISMAKSN